MSKPALRVKRIYEPAERADGTRVLVDRLWPRGLTREKAAIDHWLKEVAPSAALRSWFGHRPERWDEFVERYRRELAAAPAAPLLCRLAALAAEGDLTLLYSAQDEGRNQAVVLADALRECHSSQGA